MGDVYLVLENGAVFKGLSFGHDAEAVGELVFTTGMTGYLETLADPSYFGQIVLQTFPLIGNYGVIPADFGKGPAYLKAYVVRDWCQEPSNFRSEGNLDSFLREMKIPGVYDIDTRALTRMLRECGVMNGMLSKTPELSEEQWADLRGYRIFGAVAACAERRNGSQITIHNSQSSSTVGSSKSIVRELKTASDDPLSGGNAARHGVVVWDFGDGRRLAGRFNALSDCATVITHDTTADDILAMDPHGVVLSGGPGDPAENTGIIAEIRKLSDSGIPILGVGLGHQMLALARGAKTAKLLFGHRGANQPVLECGSRRMFVTSQNHGYAVAKDSLPDCAAMSYLNTNDGTCEGIDYSDIPAFSVQFSPSDEILARFLAL